MDVNDIIEVIEREEASIARRMFEHEAKMLMAFKVFSTLKQMKVTIKNHNFAGLIPGDTLSLLSSPLVVKLFERAIEDMVCSFRGTNTTTIYKVESKMLGVDYTSISKNGLIGEDGKEWLLYDYIQLELHLCGEQRHFVSRRFTVGELYELSQRKN